MLPGTKNALKSMSQQDLDRLSDQLDRIHSMLGIAKIVGGMVVASVGGLVTVAIWVNNTTTLLASTQVQVKTLAAERQETVKEWSAWRVKKDEVDTKVVQLLESQQHMIDRQQQILDRVTLK
jgi:hypothetical protein